MAIDPFKVGFSVGLLALLGLSGCAMNFLDVLRVRSLSDQEARMLKNAERLTKSVQVTPSASEPDRAACVAEASADPYARWLRTAPRFTYTLEGSIRRTYTLCMIARGYAVRIKEVSGRGLMAVVVRPLGPSTLDKVSDDFKACEKAAFPGPFNQGFGGKWRWGWSAWVPVPDDVRDRYLECWRGRGYEASEHKKGA
jgi:hypothetical protein